MELFQCLKVIKFRYQKKKRLQKLRLSDLKILTSLKILFRRAAPPAEMEQVTARVVVHGLHDGGGMCTGA